MKCEHQEVDSMDHMHLSAYKTDLNNTLSTHNNNNSPHKFEFKFYMWVGDQKLSITWSGHIKFAPPIMVIYWFIKSFRKGTEALNSHE